MPVELNCVVCGARFSVRPSRLKKGAKYCCYLCHQIGEGRKGGKTRGLQRLIASTGKSYPKDKGRHAHRVAAEIKIGRDLLSNEVVHHVDSNKFNNDPNNLLVVTRSEHIKLHLPDMLLNRRKKHGY